MPGTATGQSRRCFWAAALVLAVVPATARAGTEAVLYSFKGGGDGAQPTAGLLDVGGTLYGTTMLGGAFDLGTVFSITAAGSPVVVHSFKGGADGAWPEASLKNVGGILYGTTAFGGGGQCSQFPGGCGTVFSIDGSGTETLLYAFPRPKRGYNPAAELAWTGTAFYGTAEFGGALGDGGTVFSLPLNGTARIRHSFGGDGDGSFPVAGLTRIGSVFYGTTENGGANGAGTVFSLTPSGIESVLHSFGGSGDGAFPEAGLVAVDGTLYGTTAYGGSGTCPGSSSGCGTVFAITLAGAETVLHSFGGTGDGMFPQAALLNHGGKLYGTTAYGGGAGCASLGCGTVFSVTTAGDEAVEHRFSGGSDGQRPVSGLMAIGKTLYGTTQLGGAGCASAGCGTVYSYKQ